MFTNEKYQLQKYLEQEISKIPKKNKHKFSTDLLKLIQLAQKGNYDQFELPEWFN